MSESEKSAFNSLGKVLEQAIENKKEQKPDSNDVGENTPETIDGARARIEKALKQGKELSDEDRDILKVLEEADEMEEEYMQREKYEAQNQSESSEETLEADDADTEPQKETLETESTAETGVSKNTDERSGSGAAEVSDSESEAVRSRSPEETPEADGADTESQEEEKPETEPVVETDMSENTEKGKNEPEVGDGESKEDEASQEEVGAEAVKEVIEKNKDKKIFGIRLDDWASGIGGLGVGSMVSISTRALMPWTVISGAVGGGLAGMSRVVYKDWHDSERRRQKKTIRSLEKETGAKSNSGEFWETVGNSVGEWEQMLNALNKDIKRNREGIENTDNKKEKKRLERELIQFQAEAEFLNDRLRYTYAAMAQEEKETKKNKIDRIDAFVNLYDVKTGGYRKVEGEQREHLLERANKHAQEIKGIDSERRKTLRKRLTQAGLRGAAIGTVTGIVGGYLGALASDAGDYGAEVVSGDGGTPDTSTESTDPGGEPETDTSVSESTDSGDIEKGSEDGSEDGGVSESESGDLEEGSKTSDTVTSGSSNVTNETGEEFKTRGIPSDSVGVEGGEGSLDNDSIPESVNESDGEVLSGVEPGIETALDNLPETLVLESGDNPWSLVEEQLKEYLGKDPTNAEILSVAKVVAEESSISVPEWGVNGDIDYQSLSVDHELQFAGNDNVLEAIKGLME